MLGRVGLADDDAAGLAEARHQGRVARSRHGLRVQRRAEGGRQSGSILKVLDPDRDPCQWTRVATRSDDLVDRGGLSERLLGVDGDEGVDEPVELFDRLQAVLDELGG